MTTVTATIKKPSGGAWAYATVKVGILGAGMSSGVITAGVTKAQSDATGLVTLNLPANNTGESYVWTNPDGTQVTFRVPTTGGPFTLDQLVVAGSTTPTVVVGVQMVDRTATRPPNGSVIWTGGTAGTPPAGALAGDLWIHS